MAGFNNVIGRPDVSDALVPDQVVTDIIKDAPKSSVILALAKQVRLSSKQGKQPVLASAPEAYWVNGDTGLKQTSEAIWQNVTITAEELAVIVPIPDSLIDDASVPLWEEVKPLVAEAIGRAVDRAALFGVSKPDSWPEGIVPAAIAAGNVLTVGENADFGADVAALAEKISVSGVAVTGFASRPGLQWKLVGLRTTDGHAIYTAGIAGSTPAGLYGFPLNEVNNGSWNAAAAELIAADWTKIVIGIRQDITYDLFREGVISDADGKIILNLMQQDTKALRVVFRVGFQVATPLSTQTGTRPYPAGVLAPAPVAP